MAGQKRQFSTSIWIDRQYINRISCSLRNFKWKSTDLAIFSCPICGDSQSKKNKARGFFFAKGDGYNFICHNCGESSSFSFFIKNQHPSIYKEYILDTFKEANGVVQKSESEDEIPEIEIPSVNMMERFEKKKVPCVLETLQLISSLPVDHPARVYVENRKIPLEDIFYAPHFFKFANLVRPEKNYNERTIQERIIFPFRDGGGKFNGYSARSFNGEEPKYFTAKLEEGAIFGLERIDFSKMIYVVEGAIDSLFVDNCVAASTSALHKLKWNVPKKDCVLISDKDIRNKEIMKLVDRFITEGFNVCLLPLDSFIYKDFNEAIMGGMSREEIMKIVKQNTFSGMRARVNFNQWSKV